MSKKQNVTNSKSPVLWSLPKGIWKRGQTLKVLFRLYKCNILLHYVLRIENTTLDSLHIFPIWVVQEVTNVTKTFLFCCFFQIKYLYRRSLNTHWKQGEIPLFKLLVICFTHKLSRFFFADWLHAFIHPSYAYVDR